MSRNLKDLLGILGYVIFIAMIIIVGYQAIRLIIGGTWEFQDVVIAFLVVIITGLFTIFTRLAVLSERTKNIGSSMRRLGNDFREHMNKYHKSIK